MIELSEEYIDDKIKRLKASEKATECFSLAEQKKIEEYVLRKIKSQYFGILLYSYTGLRFGELLALEWVDIDLVKNEIYVSKSCYYSKNSQGLFVRITDSPKTKSSVRIVPLPKQLASHLPEIKKKAVPHM